MSSKPVTSSRTHASVARHASLFVSSSEPEHWSISYLDLLTLLLTLFVLLFALQHRTQIDTPAAEEPQSWGVAWNQIPPSQPHEQWFETRVERTEAEEPPAIEVVATDQQPFRPGILPRPLPLIIARTEPQPVTLAPVSALALQLHQAGLDQQVSIRQQDHRTELQIDEKILFAPGSGSLTPDGTSFVSELATLIGRSDQNISIEGHTDNRPIDSDRFRSNWELSAARALAVTHRFIELGIEAHRLRATGLADTRPIADNRTAQGRARNRRVVISLLAP